MAEKIGFISFTAFELRRADEFESIKTRLYHSDRPARSYFDIHPSLPPWKPISKLGIEPMFRKTPAELAPLMNEYHRYYLDKSVQLEMYERWWRRHHAWNRESEIFFDRFDLLRDHINEIYNREAYIKQGRMNLIFQKAAAKSWQNQEIETAVRAESNDLSKKVNTQLLSKRSEHFKLVEHVRIREPDQHRLSLQAHERAIATGEHHTRQELRPPHDTPPRWAKILAVADYQQKHQMPTPETRLTSHPEAVKPSATHPASVIAATTFKVGK